MFHDYTGKLKPVISLFEPQKLDEVSNRIPPTSQARKARPCETHQTCSSDQSLMRDMSPECGSHLTVPCACTRVHALRQPVTDRMMVMEVLGDDAERNQSTADTEV